MRLPPYLIALNLSALPEYEWDTVYFNTFWAVTDEDNPRLANALQLISVKAAFAIGVACSEWVVARVVGQTDTTDALLRIEAAWAAAIIHAMPNCLLLPPAYPPHRSNSQVRFASP